MAIVLPTSVSDNGTLSCRDVELQNKRGISRIKKEEDGNILSPEETESMWKPWSIGHNIENEESRGIFE